MIVLAAALLWSPSPGGDSQAFSAFSDRRDENAISAREAASTTVEPLAGASSKEASQPTTTALGASAVAAPYPHTVHEVASAAQWDTAVRSVEPGDQIRLVATINQPLQYHGARAPTNGVQGANGTVDRPITITANDDVWIDPGNLNNRKPALDVANVAHVNVVGVQVRNSQFGIRIQNSVGSADAPILISGNSVNDIGHAGIHVAGDLSTHSPSQFVRVEGNTVTRTGLSAPEFGEGIYLGYGSQEWVDRSSGLEVLNNQISYTTAEAIDIKPGTRNVLVAGNVIHDLSPIRGGAISAHYVGTRPNPDPGQSSNVVIRNNRIWNINLDGRSGSNDWAIWVGHGGVTIENNTIWGLRNDPGRTRAIRIRGLHDFGPHPIRIIDNVFWTSAGWLAEGFPSGGNLVQASGNRGPAGAVGIEVPLSPHPSTPALGSGGTADSGSGPGTALGFPLRSALYWPESEPGLLG